MAKLEEIENQKGMRLFWCPGCHCCHRIAVDKNDLKADIAGSIIGILMSI